MRSGVRNYKPRSGCIIIAVICHSVRSVTCMRYRSGSSCEANKNSDDYAYAVVCLYHFTCRERRHR